MKGWELVCLKKRKNMEIRETERQRDIARENRGGEGERRGVGGEGYREKGGGWKGGAETFCASLSLTHTLSLSLSLSLYACILARACV